MLSIYQIYQLYSPPTQRYNLIKYKIVYDYIIYGVILKDGPNFIRLYFLNYTWYVNDLRNI